jgi:hypothetical protein
MPLHKGIAPLVFVLIIAAVIALGGAYVATHPIAFQGQQTGTTTVSGQTASEENQSASLSGADIHWKFDTKAEVNNIPQTLVSVQVGETVHEVGTFEGSCTAIGANGGVDGKGLLAGELSAAQCWFAGGGDEIGVFAHEDGGYQIMVGSISEPDGEGSTGFRGDFKVKADVSL